MYQGISPLNIWGPLFKKIFSINNHIIRIKCGESVPDCMKKGKEELYPGDSNVVSFKVDLRFLHDDDEFEIDLATVECSKPDPDDEKDERDRGKLCRESKDSLDTIWDLLKDYECDIKTWSLQSFRHCGCCFHHSLYPKGILCCDSSLSLPLSQVWLILLMFLITF